MSLSWKKMRKPRISKEVFVGSIIFALAIMLTFGILSAIILYAIEMKAAHTAIKDKNRLASYYIEGYFREIKHTVSFLSHNHKIRNAYKLEDTHRSKVLNLYRSIAKSNSRIAYIYSGYKNGSLLINNYTPPEGYQPQKRPWYRAAMEAKPRISVGEPYQDINNKEWLLSIGQALRSPENMITGVLSIDTSIQSFSKLLKKRSSGYLSSYSYVIRQNGKVILHHQSRFLKKDMASIIGKRVHFEQKKGNFEYNLYGTKKLAYYNTLEDINWIVITAVEWKEIINPIIKKVILIMAITALIALLMGLGLGYFLSHRFSLPLFHLQNRVLALVNGKGKKEKTDYVYPDNEIGTIAQHVERLAEKEIYTQAMELGEAYYRVNKTNEELGEAYATIEKLYKDIKKDISLARRIQQNILPNKFHEINNIRIYVEYLPMTDVGGDLYDIITFANGTIRIFLADATGHGIQASLTTMLIKSEYERVKHTASSPADALTRLNNNFTQKYKQIIVFFTCIIVDIIPQKNLIYFSSAGHPIQYFIRKNDTIPLKKSGKLVGVIEDINYTDQSLYYRENDKLFLFTDGIYEEFNQNLEEFGEDNIYQIMVSHQDSSVKDLVDNTLGRVKEFVAEAGFSDDITTIGIDFSSS